MTRMKTSLIAMASVSCLTASTAFAQTPAEQIIADLQSQGFTRIEVDVYPRFIEVDAIRGNLELEVVYNALTGEIIRQETDRVDRGDRTAPGVFVDYDDDDDEDDRYEDDDRWDDDDDDYDDDDDDDDYDDDDDDYDDDDDDDDYDDD